MAQGTVFPEGNRWEPLWEEPWTKAAVNLVLSFVFATSYRQNCIKTGEIINKAAGKKESGIAFPGFGSCFAKWLNMCNLSVQVYQTDHTVFGVALLTIQS